jgi:predicted flap endonuclease-1-like 5' DNA nuclease
MNFLHSLFLLFAGLIGGAGAAAYLLQKEAPTGQARTAAAKLPAVEPPANAQELEQWKGRAQSVQAQLKEVEASLLSLREELAAAQGWQAKTPALVRLGQSLALLPPYKAAAADAAIAATRFPTVSADCQKLSVINGIGEIYEQRLYQAGVGSYWEVAHLSNDEFQQMLHLNNWQMQAADWDAIRAGARQLAQDNNSIGMLWEGETPDDFERIDGIGKMFELRLYRAGIRTYASLAGSTVEELHHILGPMVVKPDVQQWIAQARQLQAEKAAKGLSSK